jgi:hypothetical protein
VAINHRFSNTSRVDLRVGAVLFGIEGFSVPQVRTLALPMGRAAANARYIPPRRWRDSRPRPWRDRFPIWWLAFAVLVMLIVLVLTCWRT